jgi:hypothetical protein
MKGRAIGWLPEELAWIKANREWPRKDLHSGFCFRFGRKDVSVSTLASLCKRMGWLTGRTGCFSPGIVPMNKGKKQPLHPNSARTTFQKGQRAPNKFDVGHESVNKDGYVLICVAEPNPYTGASTHMAFKHTWLWEQANGPVPQGHALKCLDGNRQNTDPSNWECIPRAMLPRLNGVRGRNYDHAAPEIKPTIMAVTRLEHAARTLRQGLPHHERTMR